MIRCMFQNTLEAEPYNSFKGLFWLIFLICASIQLSLYIRQVNTLMEITFISRLVYDVFSLFKYDRFMKTFYRTICILLKQNCKRIILIIIIFRSGFVQNSCTYISPIQIFSSEGTAALQVIT